MAKSTAPSTLNLAPADVSVFERKGGPGRPAGPNAYLPHFTASFSATGADGNGRALLIPCTYKESIAATNGLRKAATDAKVSVQTRFLPDDVAAWDAAQANITSINKLVNSTEGQDKAVAKAALKDSMNALYPLTGKLAYRTVPLVTRKPRKAKGGDTPIVKPEGSAWN